jgi:hypothetical protein
MHITAKKRIDVGNTPWNRAGSGIQDGSGPGQCLARLARVILVLVMGLAAADAAPGSSQEPATPEAQIAALKAEMDQAIHRVQEIANQPVTHLSRTPDMDVGMYPGWFHPGAIKPNFNTVDVRATQKFDYDQFEYVSSDLNPGVVFIGHELEFNSMIKYFYTDRSVPKRKLSELEMQEINHLYRIIGHCEQQLAELQNARPQQTWVLTLISNHAYIVAAMVFLLMLVLYLVQRRRSQLEATY